ncbi:hypothetical protein B2_1 [Stenotrophomonas phage B2]|nr:hypothetical protein B2_1 [Stenotrophomonas phage B2]
MTTVETLNRLLRGYDPDFGRIDLAEHDAITEAIRGLLELDDLRAVMIAKDAKDAEIAALQADLEAVGAGGVKGVLMPGPAVNLDGLEEDHHLDPQRDEGNYV